MSTQEQDGIDPEFDAVLKRLGLSSEDSPDDPEKKGTLPPVARVVPECPSLSEIGQALVYLHDLVLLAGLAKREKMTPKPADVVENWRVLPWMLMHGFLDSTVEAFGLICEIEGEKIKTPQHHPLMDEYHLRVDESELDRLAFVLGESGDGDE